MNKWNKLKVLFWWISGYNSCTILPEYIQKLVVGL